MPPGAHMRWSDDFAQKVARWAVTNDLVTRANGRIKLTSYGREVARRAMLR